jgi:2'-5' RNA ligase
MTKYFFEIWVRGNTGQKIKHLVNSDESYHPHITLVRPFYIGTSEERVKKKVENLCSLFSPIKFSIFGEGSFSENTNYFPILGEELLMFNNQLEDILSNEVNFVERLNREKVLHLTTPSKARIEIPFEELFRYLTAIRNKKIWFSYDLLEKRFLDREESLKTIQS